VNLSGGAVAVEVWFAVGYGAFLLLVAYVLDLTARRTATRSSRWRSGAFTYQADHDAWVCPQDQWLWPQSFDPDNRVMRYRASPSVCNACPVKDSCTTHDHGREVTRRVDPWPSSEAERFHRGIACTVAAFAVVWPLLSMLGDRSSTELVLLGATTALVSIGSLPLWSHLRRAPAQFPEHVKVEKLDDTFAAARAAGQAQTRRRAMYASDRRTGGAPSQRPVNVVVEGGQNSPRQAGWSRLRGDR
jgi:hypothetical protein